MKRISSPLLYISIIFLILLGTIFIVQVPAEHETGNLSDLELSDNQAYRVEIIASNFEYKLIDLVKVDRLMSEGWNETMARINATFYDEVSYLGHGMAIEVQAKSSEGTHGLVITELNLEFYLDKPGENEEFGQTIVGSSVLPSVDTTMRLYCNVFCGVGHSEMDFTMKVGEGKDFGDNSIDILSDWRVWAMFGAFFVVTFGIVGIAIVRPRFFFSWDDTDE